MSIDMHHDKPDNEILGYLGIHSYDVLSSAIRVSRGVLELIAFHSENAPNSLLQDLYPLVTHLHMCECQASNLHDKERDREKKEIKTLEEEVKSLKRTIQQKEQVIKRLVGDK